MSVGSAGHVVARLTSWLKVMAVIRIRPVAMSWKTKGTPTRIMPLKTTARMSAPTSDPITVPSPPVSAVPPMTAAAIAGSSSPSPVWDDAVVRRPATIKPAILAAHT